MIDQALVSYALGLLQHLFPPGLFVAIFGSSNMSNHSSDGPVGTPSASVLREWQSYLLNDTPKASSTSLNTVQRLNSQQLTSNSLRSLESLTSSPLGIRNENVQPARLLRPDEAMNGFSSPRRTSKHSSRKSSWANDVPGPLRARNVVAVQESRQLEKANLDFPQANDYDSPQESDKENRGPGIKEARLSFDQSSEEVLSVNGPTRTLKAAKSRVLPDNSAGPRTSNSFKRWIDHLRPPTLKRKKTLTVRQQRWPLDESPNGQDKQDVRKTNHVRRMNNKTDPQPSTGLIDAMKAAVTDRPDCSPTPKPLRRSNLFSRSNRSSRRSEDQARLSAETNALEVAASERTTQRQKTLEELVVSEAGYIADLKVLIHVSKLSVVWRQPVKACSQLPGLFFSAGSSPQCLPSQSDANSAERH